MGVPDWSDVHIFPNPMPTQHDQDLIAVAKFLNVGEQGLALKKMRHLFPRPWPVT